MANKVRDLEAKNQWDSTRQRDWFDPSDEKFVNLNLTVVGAGGIGSPLVMLLTKLGVPRLNLIDFDKIELHNLPNQCFPRTHVGRAKVESLKIIASIFGVTEVKPFEMRVEDAPPHAINGVVLTGLDSMQAREEVWKKVRLNSSIPLLIDARIGGLDVVIHCVDPCDIDQIEYYEEIGLFSDEEGIEAPCTARGRSDLGFAVASIMQSLLVTHLRGDGIPKTITYNHQKLRFANAKWPQNIQKNSPGPPTPQTQTLPSPILTK